MYIKSKFVSVINHKNHLNQGISIIHVNKCIDRIIHNNCILIKKRQV